MRDNRHSRTSEPVVSAVMPVFNVSQYVDEAVRSILAQSVRELELIVVDDGSTDATAAILDDIAKEDQRLHVLRQGRLGAVAAFNLAAGVARGRYLGWLGGDDVALPNRFAAQVHFLDAHPQVAALGGSVVVIDALGRRVGVLRYPTLPGAIRAALSSANPIAAPAAMIRKSAYHAIGGCRAAFVGAEDYDLWLRLSERFQLSNLPEFLVHYRVHDEQVSSRNFEQVALSTSAALLSTSLRRSGLNDPFDAAGAITRDRLVAAGLDERTIDERLAQLISVRATVLVISGRARNALTLLDSAYARPTYPRLSREVRAMLAISRARALWKVGDRTGAFAAGLSGIREDIGSVARAAFRGATAAIGAHR